MFLSVVQSEWFKFRKSGMLPVLFVGPAIGLMIGLMTNITGMEADVNAWYLLLQFMILPYALLFLPLMTGVLAGLICRYEHQAGGWKQFLSLPVTRGSVFFTKYLLLIASVFIIQMLFLGAVYMAGVMKGIADPFPMMIIWKSVLGGWVATFPLVALQLWMSTVWKALLLRLQSMLFSRCLRYWR